MTKENVPQNNPEDSTVQTLHTVELDQEELQREQQRQRRADVAYLSGGFALELATGRSN